MSTYCDLVKELPESHPHRLYHDQEYGFPIKDDNELFGRLILEINQAGLNWLTILKKKEGFRTAFSNFDIEKVAKYGKIEKSILLENPAIIRNRLKIEAVIHNANQLLEIQKEFGSFNHWLNIQQAISLSEWTKIFKNKFKFMGPLIVEEFLMSISLIKGAHQKECPIYDKVLSEQPNWNKK